MAQEGPRHARITSTDHGPAVNVASWILMAVTILFTLFRLVSNFVLRGAVSADDAIIALATFVAVAQTAALSGTVHYGIGQHQESLSAHMIDGYQKVFVTRTFDGRNTDTSRSP